MARAAQGKSGGAKLVFPASPEVLKVRLESYYEGDVVKLSEFSLVSQKDDDWEGHFSWRGCENEDCPSKGLGNNVYDCEAYKSLEEAQADPEGNLYEFSICFDCLYEHEYGERPER